MKRTTADNVASMCDQSIEILVRIRRDAPELVRRERFAARDGYPASSLAERTSGGGRSDRVVILATTDEPADPVRMAIENVFRLVKGITGDLRSADNSRRGVIEAAEEKRGRESTVSECRACGRTVAGTEVDRLRSGYCERDYRQWIREGRPDRMTFEHNQREDVSA